MRVSWDLVADFTVVGTPKAQPRPRAFARKDKAGDTIVRMYEAGTAESWKGGIAVSSAPHLPKDPLDGPLKVEIDFFLPRPKRLMRKKDPEGEVLAPKKPDRDNLEKAVLDAMSNIGWWHDDAQVCCGEVRKLYHSKHGRPRALIRVWSAVEPTNHVKVSA